MEISRIIPNISSTKMEESKEFYTNFLGLKIVMDMHWVLTFASPSNPTSQINIVQLEKNFSPKVSKNGISLYDFADYFKRLGCKNALYLDGFVSRTYLPEKNWIQLDGDFGVMIGITEAVK